MDARCNISNLALDLINQARYGVKCDIGSSDKLYQHYLNGLDCNPEDIICLDEFICQEEDSNNCTFYISNITYLETYTPQGILKYIDFSLGDAHNHELPLDYVWNFRGTNYQPITNLTSPLLRLEPINPFISSTVSVSIQCKDNLGCIASKTCEYDLTVTFNPETYYTYESGIGCLF